MCLCSAYSCNAHEFRCGDGLCVKKLFICDGIRQCNDGSDETHCNDNDVGSDNKIIGKTHSFTSKNQKNLHAN